MSWYRGYKEQWKEIIETVAAEEHRTTQITHILYHLKVDQKHYRRLFSGESVELFWNYFRRCFELELCEEMRKTYKEKKNTIPEDLFTGLYTGIFIETVKWWFKDGCKKTPEQVERYFEEVF